MNLNSRITDLMDTKDRVVIAIDGKCASGKSTLAKKLEDKYNATVFHMDDFFLPFVRKTVERLSEAGGNVDYERAYEEIFSHLEDDSITYGRFDCSNGQVYEETKKLEKLVVIEGAYSMRPEFRMFYDLTIFSDIDYELQKNRIKERNGEEMLSKFIKEWIPLENTYFDELDIKNKSEIVLGE